MRFLKNGFLLTVSFILLQCFTRATNACECLQSKPPCSAYWQADAVFAGLVTNISPGNKDYEASGHNGIRKVTFSIISAYRGIKNKKEVEIQSTISSCEYTFEKGDRYLVYAYRNTANSSLETSGCTRTTRLPNATEDVAFIRSLSGGAAERFISGVVSEHSYTPVMEVKVTAKGQGKEYKSSSDKDGRFKIPVPKSGKYTVRIDLPPNTYVVGLKHQVEQISRSFFVKDNQVTLEYDVNVGVGNCAFIDVPVFTIRDSP